MKIPMNSLLAVLHAVSLSGCVTPIPIDNLNYRGTAAVKSDKVAQVAISSSGIGTAAGTTIMPVAGAFIAIPQSSGVVPFGTKDQQEFLLTLKKELVRLGIVKSTTSIDGATADFNISVNIDRSFFNFDRPEHKVECTLSISGAKGTFKRQYQIISSEEDSLWEKLNTNGAQAREKLAHQMLARLIPDIELYVLGISKP